MTVVLGIFTTLIQLYPFTLEQTLILLGVLKAAFDAIINKQWTKLEKVVMDEALPLFTEALDNEAKRDAVVKKVWESMPMSLRMLAKPDQVEKFVDKIYNLYVKPEAKRQKLEKGTPEPMNPIAMISDLFGE